LGDWKHTLLGRTGRTIGRLGLAASYGADERCVALAFERGVQYMYWGSRRSASFGAGLRALKSRRDQFLLVIQSYARVPYLLTWSLERALRQLDMDYADVLLLGFWNKGMSASIFEKALELRERGLVRHLAISTHNRPLATEYSAQAGLDILHVRYNAIHTGAEREIFPNLAQSGARPGIVSFTATSWGQLMKPDKLPPGTPLPSAGDCYRFVLTNPAVDVCITGPASVAQLESTLNALEKGPMNDDELQWMRQVGQAKYSKPGRFSLR